MSMHELADKPIALIHMPPPEEGSEAFFVAVVLLASMAQRDTWPDDVQARVFTLERELDDNHPEEGVICEWSRERTHRNFGLRIVAKPETFLQAIVTLLQEQPLPVAGTSADGGVFLQSIAPEPTRKKPWWKIW